MCLIETPGDKTNTMYFLFQILCVLLLSMASSIADDRPNILLVIADDCTYNDLPLYGGKNAKTPNIDRLGKEGVVFNRAYLCEAMCQPCRAALYTGLYPMRNGCAWNHSSSRPAIRSLPNYLTQLGYRVGLAGKVHVKPKQVFSFEDVAGFDSNCVRNPTQQHDLGAVHEFMSRDSEEPFCLVVALVEPHRPWVMGDPSVYPPKKIELPSNLVDTPQTRQDFSAYLAEITYMDEQVGDLLETLRLSGHEQDTLVLFTSEQGSQFPGNKWTNWDTGLHTALIARWPNSIQAGTRTNAIVQYVDMVPTLIDLAGGSSSKLDGQSFLGVLSGESQQHRSCAYGMHNNLPEGSPYPIRTVTDGEYRYIRNLYSESIYTEKHVMGPRKDGRGPMSSWMTWLTVSWNTPHALRMVTRYMRRPEEELYHTASDPYELNNLSHESKLAHVKKRLSAELDDWLASQHDPGLIMDTMEVYQASKQGKHPYPKKQ